MLHIPDKTNKEKTNSCFSSCRCDIIQTDWGPDNSFAVSFLSSFFPFISHSSLYFPLLPLFPTPPFISHSSLSFLFLFFLLLSFLRFLFFSVQLLFLLPLIFFFSIFSFFLSFFFHFLFFPLKWNSGVCWVKNKGGRGWGRS